MKWISVKDKLPPESYYCFVCMGDEAFHGTAIAYYEDNEWCSIDRRGIYSVVFWKKIIYPKTPKEWPKE